MWEGRLFSEYAAQSKHKTVVVPSSVFTSMVMERQVAERNREGGKLVTWNWILYFEHVWFAYQSWNRDHSIFPVC